MDAEPVQVEQPAAENESQGGNEEDWNDDNWSADLL